MEDTHIEGGVRMKKKILVADKDSSLKEAFRVIFSDDQYEILYASNGKEAEKLAEENRPQIYIVNVNLSKYTGIEVYKKLQKEKYLEGARFFFLKDENDRTELLGFQAEGVIEKPINFFKVHERIHREEKEDEVIELTEVIEEPAEATVEAEPASTSSAEQPVQVEPTPAEPSAPAAPVPVEDVPAQQEEMAEPTFPDLTDSSPEPATAEKLTHTEEPKMEERPNFETKETVPERGVATEAINLDVEIKAALGSVMQDAATKLVEAMTPAVSKYIEDYTRQVLFDIAEKVIREEIDKLLKESSDFPGKQI
jgi:DNA-binding NarL/FixJ family response regulator